MRNFLYFILLIIFVSCEEKSEFIPAEVQVTFADANKVSEARFTSATVDANSCFNIIVSDITNYEYESVKIEILNGDLCSLSQTKDGEYSSQITISNPAISSSASGIAPQAVTYSYYIKPRADILHSFTGSSTKISLKVTATLSDEETSKEYNLILYRPPIIFVHGLGSSAETFLPMIAYIKQKGLYEDKLLFALDYSETDIASYETNSNVIIEAIDKLKADLSDIYIDKVDIVGHSMGGILARLYLQSNEYRDDIRSFISIDTPHFGSQAANLGIDLSETHPDYFGIFANMGAVVDLQIDSPATQQLSGEKMNLNKVPSHCITASTDVATSVLVDNLIANQNHVGALLTYLVGDFSAELYGGKNDICVALDSQNAMSDNKFTTHFDDQWHNSIHGTESCAVTVTSLLKEVENGDKFNTNGFIKKTLIYNSSLPIISPIASGEIVVDSKVSKRFTVVYTPTQAVNSVLFMVVNEDGEIRDIDVSKTAPYTNDIPSYIPTGNIYVIAKGNDKVLYVSGAVKF